MNKDGMAPVEDDEIIARRIPAAANPPRYDGASQAVSFLAFAPSKDDITGISVIRLSRFDIEPKVAALGRAGKLYYLAKLRAIDIRLAGMTIDPRPLPDCPSHAEIPELTYEKRKLDLTLSRQAALARLCFEVLGPFETQQD